MTAQLPSSSDSDNADWVGAKQPLEASRHLRWAGSQCAGRESPAVSRAWVKPSCEQGLARVVTAQLSLQQQLGGRQRCAKQLSRENILEGQPAALTCPQKDCGILAVRVKSPGVITLLHEVLYADCPATRASQTMHACAAGKFRHAVQRTLLSVSSAD